MGAALGGAGLVLDLHRQRREDGAAELPGLALHQHQDPADAQDHRHVRGRGEGPLRGVRGPGQLRGHLQARTHRHRRRRLHHRLQAGLAGRRDLPQHALPVHGGRPLQRGRQRLGHPGSPVPAARLPRQQLRLAAAPARRLRVHPGDRRGRGLPAPGRHQLPARRHPPHHRERLVPDMGFLLHPAAGHRQQPRQHRLSGRPQLLRRAGELPDRRLAPGAQHPLQPGCGLHRQRRGLRHRQAGRVRPGRDPVRERPAAVRADRLPHRRGVRRPGQRLQRPGRRHGHDLLRRSLRDAGRGPLQQRRAELPAAARRQLRNVRLHGRGPALQRALQRPRRQLQRPGRREPHPGLLHRSVLLAGHGRPAAGHLQGGPADLQQRHLERLPGLHRVRDPGHGRLPAVPDPPQV